MGFKVARNDVIDLGINGMEYLVLEDIFAEFHLRFVLPSLCSVESINICQYFNIFKWALGLTLVVLMIIEWILNSLVKRKVYGLCICSPLVGLYWDSSWHFLFVYIVLSWTSWCKVARVSLLMSLIIRAWASSTRFYKNDICNFVRYS